MLQIFLLKYIMYFKVYFCSYCYLYFAHFFDSTLFSVIINVLQFFHQKLFQILWLPQFAGSCNAFIKFTILFKYSLYLLLFLQYLLFTVLFKKVCLTKYVFFLFNNIKKCQLLWLSNELYTYCSQNTWRLPNIHTSTLHKYLV